MKNIIRTLAISSVLCVSLTPSFLYADEVYNEVENQIVKNKGFEVKTISYKEQYSVDKWHNDLKEMFEYEYDPYARKILKSMPNVEYGTPKYGAIIQLTKAQMLDKFWKQINTDFKDSKNAKVAFCKYTEDIGIISDSLRVCDKNYDYHNQKNVRIDLVYSNIINEPEPISNKNKKPM